MPAGHEDLIRESITIGIDEKEESLKAQVPRSRECLKEALGVA